MGADLWSCDIAGSPDPAEALLAIQTRLAAEYHFAAILANRQSSVQETIRFVMAEGDPYDLLDFYRRELATIERAMRSPIPRDPCLQIELIRELESFGCQGVGNLLDVRGISDHRDIDFAERLDPDEMIRFVGTTRPTWDQARAAIGAINEDLRRGECVCFPYYDGTEIETPAGWFFIGNTHD